MKITGYGLIAVIDFLALELALGLLFPYNQPAATDKNDVFIVSSPTRVHQFIPNASFTYDGAVYHTNSLGYRDHEFSLKKPAGARRIAVLGDSFVEGMGEAQEKTIPKAIEALLRRQARGPVQVMNCGVRGGSPATYYFWLRELVRYKPDAVVLCVAENDMDDDACALLTKALYRARAWYALPEWLRYSNVVAYAQGEAANLIFKFHRKSLSRRLFNEDDFKRDNRRQDKDANAIGCSAYGFFIEPERWKEPWERTKGNLSSIADFLRAEGIPLVVVFIPSDTGAGLAQDPFADWVGEWASSRGLPYVNLHEQIRAWAGDTRHAPLYRSTYGHFSANGLGWVADRISVELKKTIAL